MLKGMTLEHDIWQSMSYNQMFDPYWCAESSIDSVVGHECLKDPIPVPRSPVFQAS